MVVKESICSSGRRSKGLKLTENSGQGDVEGSDRDNNKDAEKRIQKLKRKDVEMATEDEVGSDLRRLLEPNALRSAGSKEASTICSLHSSDETQTTSSRAALTAPQILIRNLRSAEAKKGRGSD